MTTTAAKPATTVYSLNIGRIIGTPIRFSERPNREPGMPAYLFLRSMMLPIIEGMRAIVGARNTTGKNNSENGDNPPRLKSAPNMTADNPRSATATALIMEKSESFEIEGSVAVNTRY